MIKKDENNSVSVQTCNNPTKTGKLYRSTERPKTNVRKQDQDSLARLNDELSLRRGSLLG